METIKIKLKDIKPYKKNAKLHPREQIEQIKYSIENFGFNDPIAVWGKDNIIVEGHGRYLACKELGYEEIPCIRLDHMTDEERKAYTLAHNQLTMNSDFDYGIVNEELSEIINIDMDFLGFDVFNNEEEENERLEFEEERENERMRTVRAYNLDLVDKELTDGYYEIPIIENNNYIPKDVRPLNGLPTEDVDYACCFYCDDYKFERFWNTPSEYIDILARYDCVFSPDFSLYTDMPLPMKIWNIYRSRMLGQYWQQNGLKVIPTISWCERKTFDFCFDGIPKGSIVSVSTIGVKQSQDAFKIWTEGMDEMIKRIEPSTIIVYGGKVEYDYKDINVIYFENEKTERLKNLKKKG